MRVCEGMYVREDGTQTGEATNILHGLQPLIRLYGKMPAGQMRPRHLWGFCEAQAKAKVSRSVINKRIQHIKRMLEWAKNEELIPPVQSETEQVPIGAHDACRDFSLLKKGRPVRGSGTVPREAEPVEAVAEETVNQTKACLPPTIATMIDLQLAASMRPAEVCGLKMSMVDIQRTPWLYEPRQHKTAHHKKRRRIYFGPKARVLLTPYLLRDRETFVFRPVDAVAEAGDMDIRGTALSFTTRTYRDAIWKACDRAFPAPEDIRGAFLALKRAKAKAIARKAAGKPAKAPEKSLVKRAAAEAAWRSSHRWSPNQLRHSGLSEIVEREMAAAKDRARAVAGHGSAQTTETYLSISDELAAAVMEQAG